MCFKHLNVKYIAMTNDNWIEKKYSSWNKLQEREDRKGG